MTQRRIYQCAFPYFVTFNILNRVRVFGDEEKAELLHKIILNAGRLKGHLVYQFAIMPDHVHMVCKPQHLSSQVTGAETCVCEGNGNNINIHSADLRVRAVRDQYTISDFMYSMKSFFVYQMRKQFGYQYKFLQTRYNFRIIDNEEYLHNVIHYITNNPIKAELPKRYQKHPYQYLDDGLISGFS